MTSCQLVTPHRQAGSLSYQSALHQSGAWHGRPAREAHAQDARATSHFPSA